MRTPRGLLATLGATLSLVAAAACVLIFTSTLVAVNGWPGLSAPPNTGPVALAPTERALKDAGGRSGAGEPPLVLGAPAGTTAPAAPVGPGSTPGDTQARGADIPSEQIETSPGTENSTPVGTGETPSVASPVSIVPIPAAPTDSESSIVPAVQPPSNTAPSSTPGATDDAGPTPSSRRVAVSTPVAQDETSGDDEAQAYTPQTQQPSARRGFAPSAPEQESAEEPQNPFGEEEPAEEPESESPARAIAKPQPSHEESAREGEDGWQRGDLGTEGETKPDAEPKPDAKLQPQTERAPDAAPQPDPCSPQPEPEPKPQPEPQVEQEPQPEPQPEAQASPPAADQAPAAEQAPPAAEQTPAPPAQSL